MRSLACDAERVTILAYAAVSASRLSADPWAAAQQAMADAEAELEALREALATAVDADLVFRLDLADLRDALGRADPDAVVLGPFGALLLPRALQWTDDIVRVGGRPTVWLGAEGDGAGPVVVPYDGDRAGLVPIAAFLRDRAGAGRKGVVVPLRTVDAPDLARSAELFGLSAPLEWRPVPKSAPSAGAMVLASARAEGAGVLLLADGTPGALTTMRTWLLLYELALLAGPPVVILPAATAPARGLGGALDAPDVLVLHDPVVARVDHLGSLGQPMPLPAQPIALFAAGVRIARAEPPTGEIEVPIATIPPGPRAMLGLGRSPTDERDPLRVIELSIAAIRPGDRPVTLFDADVPAASIRSLRDAIRDPDRLLIAVRARASRSCKSLRERLLAAGLAEPIVVDARMLLAEGNPDDVPVDFDAVRLCRVAARLRAAGVCVDSVIHASDHPPTALGFVALHADELADPAGAMARISNARVPIHAAADARTARLDLCAGAVATTGNEVALRFDNAAARRELIALVDAARERVHLQFYIIRDDPVIVGAVERALAAAAARGVRIRLLIDSMYSLHGSFGLRNPLADRIAALPNTTVIASRPVGGTRPVEELKQRDHRKLVVVDQHTALVTGRNLSRPYFEGLEEVALTPTTSGLAVPWPDSGVRLQGPAVTVIERAFLEAWTSAGGDAFEVRTNPPAGSTAVRVVLHHGLRDAFTLEAHLALIDGARERLDVLNSFPLHLEVQTALVRAIARGVRVRAVFGNVRPLFGEPAVAFAGGALREIVTQLVHARMDALVEAGGEAWELAFRDRPGWDPGLGPVRPHVHAKAMVADGEICALGSANLDVTAGYWENEILLVIEDPAVASACEAAIDGLLTTSFRIVREDPVWRARAGRRAWLSRYWPSLIL